MEPKKLKRMIYIYEENVEFYDNLPNKSAFINDMLFREVRKHKPQDNIEFVRQRVAAMDAKNREKNEDMPE